MISVELEEMDWQNTLAAAKDNLRQHLIGIDINQMIVDKCEIEINKLKETKKD